MKDKKWMIYGANGYTGKLIVEQAVGRGWRPILAGRREAQISQLAQKYQLPSKIFSLDSLHQVQEALAGVELVLNCAGPFIETYAPLVEAALQTGTHYLDITGEIDVFESIMRRNEEAKSKGVLLLPGVGFDVVPTDCLSLLLAEKLPRAQNLELAFGGSSRLSPGTSKTMLKNIPEKGKVRRGGAIIQVPLLAYSKNVPLGGKMRRVVSISWGDVSTAYHTTGIPNIVVYTSLPPQNIRLLKVLAPLLPVLSHPFLQKKIGQWIERKVQGPDESMRLSQRMNLWGRVEDPGKKIAYEASYSVPEGYQFTMLSAVTYVERVLRGPCPAGALTPAKAFGPQLMRDIVPDWEIHWQGPLPLN